MHDPAGNFSHWRGRGGVVDTGLGQNTCLHSWLLQKPQAPMGVSVYIAFSTSALTLDMGYHHSVSASVLTVDNGYTTVLYNINAHAM